MENEGNDGGGEGGSGGGSGEQVFTLTQAQLNAKMAENKRNLQRELAEAKKKSQAFESLQAQVSDLLGSGLIDGVEDLSDFRNKAGETIEAFKTEKQRFEEQSSRAKKDLEAANKRAQDMTQRYNSAQISRSITDEVGSKVVSPGAAELIQLKLAPLATVADDGTVSIKMVVKDEDGKAVEKQLSVKEAVGIMEADVTNYGTLFRSSVNSGTGTQVDGVRKANDGTIDFEKLDFEKFLEVQKKDPGLLGRSVATLR